MQTNVQIDSKNLRSNDDNFRSRGHHITIEVSAHLTHVLDLVLSGPYVDILKYPLPQLPHW